VIAATIREVDVPQTLFAVAAIVAALGVPAIFAAYQSRKAARSIEAVGKQAARHAATAVDTARKAVAEAELSNGRTLGETVETLGKTVDVMQADQHAVRSDLAAVQSNQGRMETSQQRVEGKVDAGLAELASKLDGIVAESAPLADWIRRAMRGTKGGRRFTDAPDDPPAP
jgi:hypothetical protein